MNRNKITKAFRILAGSVLVLSMLLTTKAFMLDSYAEGQDNAVAGNTNQTDNKSDNTAKRPFPVPVPDGVTPSITVKMKTADDVLVNGDTLALYKIAYIDTDDHGYRFFYEKDYASLETGNPSYPLSTYGLDDPDSVLTPELAEAAAAKNAAEVDSKPVEKGLAKFDLPGKTSEDKLGLYLVVLKEQTEENKGKYVPIKPFLVTVPYYNEQNELVYKVTAETKQELKDLTVKKLSPCKADPPVRKVVKGAGAPAGDEFTFTFTRLDDNYPMPNGLNQKSVSLTLKNDAGGEMDKSSDFGDITFEKAWKYTYEIRETPNGKYDTTPEFYKITYDVVIDPKDPEGKGLIVDKVTIEQTGANAKILTEVNEKYAQLPASEITFTNTFKTTPEPEPEPGPQPRPRGRDSDRDERTPSPSVNPGTTPPQVLGEYREPEGEVLGADRMPEQAVLGADRLPQTGQLWWPVPILLVGGFALIGGGFVGRKHED